MGRNEHQSLLLIILLLIILLTMRTSGKRVTSHRVVITFDEELQLAAVSAECDCVVCLGLQEQVARFLDEPSTDVELQDVEERA